MGEGVRGGGGGEGERGGVGDEEETGTQSQKFR